MEGVASILAPAQAPVAVAVAAAVVVVGAARPPTHLAGRSFRARIAR